ncbi:MAG TPA: DMT family transporter [Burkholderiales bacterium]
MKNTVLLGLLALASGGLIAVQAAANAALSRTLQSNVPFVATTLFFVALAGAAIVLASSGRGLPSTGQLAEAPWWSYTGGLIVAFYVFTITFLAPRIGVGNAIALIVAGQILAALAIDHFGLMRSLVFEMNWTRAAGAALMIVGVFLALKR